MPRGRSSSSSRASRKKIATPLYLAIVGGLLLAAPWIWWPLTPLIFIALVPFLCINDHYKPGSGEWLAGKYFLFVYTGLVIFNALSTWWVSLSTIGGGIAAVLANAALQAVPLVLYRNVSAKTKFNRAIWSLPAFWLSFEYLHQNWDLSWPWLNIGNTFINMPDMVQWYEYTGTLGGAFWIIWVNVVIYRAFTEYDFSKTRYASAALMIAAPITLSYMLKLGYEEAGKPIEVVVVQPNIDPYKQKFSGSKEYIEPEKQIERMIHMADNIVSPNTKFVLFPETAVPQLLNEETLNQDFFLSSFRSWQNGHKNIDIVTGATTFKMYKSTELASSTSRISSEGARYDVFNSALYLPQNRSIEVYHKSKLVPGVERLPFPELLGLIDALIVDMGGTKGALGTQKKRSIFTTSYNISVAPVICYESVFGEFVTEYIRKGADFIGIITNDGWWGNTPGHVQHLRFARLRAIETRKWIARSANTGISGFISPTGEITQESKYWEPAVLKQTIYTNNTKSFYVQNGDYLAYIAIVGCFGGLLFLLVGRAKKATAKKS